MRDPTLHAKKTRKKKRDEEKNKSKCKGKYKGKQKNKIEAFHSFYQAILPFIEEIWKDMCIDRNTLVIGGRIGKREYFCPSSDMQTQNRWCSLCTGGFC